MQPACFAARVMTRTGQPCTRVSEVAGASVANPFSVRDGSTDRSEFVKHTPKLGDWIAVLPPARHQSVRLRRLSVVGGTCFVPNSETCARAIFSSAVSIVMRPGSGPKSSRLLQFQRDRLLLARVNFNAGRVFERHRFVAFRSEVVTESNEMLSRCNEGNDPAINDKPQSSAGVKERGRLGLVVKRFTR